MRYLLDTDMANYILMERSPAFERLQDAVAFAPSSC